MKRSWIGMLCGLLLGPTALWAQAPMAPATPAPTTVVVTAPATTTVLVAADWDDGGGGAKFWASAEYLSWWVKQGPLATPLVAVSSNPNASAFGINTSGGLGMDGTTVAFGPGDIDFNVLSGGRLTLGMWFDAEQSAGVELRAFILENGAVNFIRDGGLNGNPVGGIPIFDVQNGSLENNVADSFPDVATGSTSVSAHSKLWGAEANYLSSVSTGNCTRTTLIVGYRYMSLVEDLNIRGVSSDLTGLGVAIAGNFFPGGIISALDHFGTQNSFHGVNLGGRFERTFGNAFVNVTGKVALGVNHQLLDIQGYSTLGGPGYTPRTVNAGVLALPTNISHRTHDEFSVIPEVEFRVGYNITPGIRAFVGYNYLYWTNVVRPGTHVNRAVDVSQIPSIAPFNPNIVASNPGLPAFRNSDYWAQGVNFGLEFKY